MLVDGMHGDHDMSPACIEQVFGIPLMVNPPDPNDYGHDGKLSDAWTFSFSSVTDPEGGKPTPWRLSFDDQAHAGADMSLICGLDAGEYVKDLVTAGDKASRCDGEHRRRIFWDLMRGRVPVIIDVRRESDARAEHHGVPMVTIETMKG